MEAYESHSVISTSPTWGPYKFPNGSITWGPYSAPAVPSSFSGSFEPRTETMMTIPSPKPSPSWEAVKRSGTIRMTPYTAERITTFNNLARIEDCAVNFFRPADYNVKTSPISCAGVEYLELATRWHEQGDYLYWSTKSPATILNDWTKVDVTSAVASTQTSAIASFKGGFDALTELAEAREGFQFAQETSASLYDLFSSFNKKHGDVVERESRRRPGMTARDMMRHADQNVRRAGSAWLAYRYALMPLYYSYKDVKDLIERNGTSYQTFRSRDTIDLTAPSLAGRSNGLYDVASGQIVVSSTIKAGYSNAFLQDYVSNQVQWNPFATAWELVPLSFVFDWFVNVGDFIVASTSSDFSQQAAGCTSVKTHVTVEGVLRNSVSKTFQRSWPVLQYGCQNSVVVRSYPFQTNTTETCRTTTIERYVRTPFDLNAQELSFNPSMNWKRTADAFALSHSPLKKLLRRFKK